ncbi:hypothetical protein Agub_g13032 [Astrephomene gubernaculifera]|uniref:Uncharacterized protein n=1 Tax=Astrephomene gubernaculifera TaxID=47775 RepID=A0AAD3HR52_9CHLO|nr:hypothetical protein Agub_g13032 [Astrephomene gubernaculifera]
MPSLPSEHGVKESSRAAVEASRNAPLRRRRPAAGTTVDAGTLQFNDMPDYLQDNEFIKSYYRNPKMPFKQTLGSLFGIHNETGNVWTHLLGFLLFAGLTFYVIAMPPMPLALGKRQIDHLWLSVRGRVHGLTDQLHNLQGRLPHLTGIANLHQLQESLDTLVHNVDSLVHDVQEEVHQAAQALHNRVHSLSDNIHHARERLNDALREALSDVLLWPIPRWPVYVFMAGAMTCLFLSAVCHLFGCCSKHLAQIIWRFDYAGIAILIVASFYPPVYYEFLCQPYWRIFYLTTTTLMGAGAVAVSLLDVFQRAEWRAFRAGMFAALGGWGAVPLLHACVALREVAAVRQATALDALMGALYLAGALIYATRVPERWLPGRFDVWLHGHQIFHILIVVAALVHWQAVMRLLAWREASGGCAGGLAGMGGMGMGGMGLQEVQGMGMGEGRAGEDAMAAAGFLGPGGGGGMGGEGGAAAAGGGAGGHEPLLIEQVWERLHAYTAEYLGALAARGEAGAAAAAGGGGGAGPGPAPNMQL